MIKKPTEPAVIAKKRYWVVMKAHTWDSLTVLNGIPIQAPPDGPQRFIPVFDSMEQAAAWANAGDCIQAIEEI